MKKKLHILAVDEIVAKPFDFEELRDIITGLEEEV